MLITRIGRTASVITLALGMMPSLRAFIFLWHSSELGARKDSDTLPSVDVGNHNCSPSLAAPASYSSAMVPRKGIENGRPQR